MKFTIIYVRTLTIEEEIEADSLETMRDIAYVRMGDLHNSDYSDATDGAEIHCLDNASITHI